VVRRDRSRWYRVVNDARDVELDWLTIAAVERILDEPSINMAPFTEGPRPRRGAAARRRIALAASAVGSSTPAVVRL
jgi:hypothetical protein